MIYTLSDGTHVDFHKEKKHFVVSWDRPDGTSGSSVFDNKDDAKTEKENLLKKFRAY